MSNFERVIPVLTYQDLQAAHDFLVNAFGFNGGGVHRNAEGEPIHGEVHAGDATIWLHRVTTEHRLDSPLTSDVANSGLFVHVDDVDAQQLQERHGAGQDLARILAKIGNDVARGRFEGQDSRAQLVAQGGDGLLQKAMLVPGSAAKLLQFRGVRFDHALHCFALRADGSDVLLFPRIFAADGLGLGNRLPPLLQHRLAGRLPQRVPQTHGDAPVAHRTARVSLGDGGERLHGFRVPERV